MTKEYVINGITYHVNRKIKESEETLKEALFNYFFSYIISELESEKIEPIQTK